MTKADKAWGYSLRRNYGITIDDYNQLLEKQDHSCAICRKHKNQFTKRLAVDHDHVTREVRGLLCTYCNHRLVGRHRNAPLLRRIADYLEQGTGWFVPKKQRRRKTARKVNIVDGKKRQAPRAKRTTPRR